MTIDLTTDERELLKKILASYLGELRQAIASTKRGTEDLHNEEDMIKVLQARIA